MDELIRSKMHEALDAIEPPRGLRALNSIPSEGPSPRSSRTIRFEWAYGMIAALLAVAIVAGLLYARGLHQNVPSHQTIHASPARPASGMATPTAGWYIGPGGHVLRTTNGGQTWADVTPSNYVATYVFTYFFDAEHAWITQAASPTSFLVLRTSDGGRSWQRGAPFTVAGLHSRGPISLFFLDSDQGWLLGISGNPMLPFPQSVEFGFVYRTTDGGAHWKRVADTGSRAPACPWVSISFSSPSTGWITTFCGQSGKPELLVSRDGGAHWATDPLPAVPGDGTRLGLQFFDPTEGLLWIDTGTDAVVLFATSDGGQTWAKRPLPGQSVIAGHFIDPQHGWVVAGPTSLATNDPSTNALPLPLYRTDDGGLTWKAVPNNLTLGTPQGRIQDVYFINHQSGFAVAVQPATYTNGSRALYATNDGGATWKLAGQIPT